MRLWHIDLIPYLPKSQLLAQWRELNSIFKKEDKHILINYIYNYDKAYLLTYSFYVINEINSRGYRIKMQDNFKKYFQDFSMYKVMTEECRFKEHNDEYLMICYFNLREKYIRAQKDFTKDVWEKLNKYYMFRMLNLNNYGMITEENKNE